jgi:hypothetical protein
MGMKQVNFKWCLIHEMKRGGGGGIADGCSVKLGAALEGGGS